MALDDQFAALEGWNEPSEVAGACRLVLGADEAAALGADLGPAAHNVLQIAFALGYEEGRE